MMDSMSGFCVSMNLLHYSGLSRLRLLRGRFFRRPDIHQKISLRPCFFEWICRVFPFERVVAVERRAAAERCKTIAAAELAAAHQDALVSGNENLPVDKGIFALKFIISF
ncbi:hypothetical protein LVJ83_13435 [Uruburuella testudinis]|uniref:Uncharacterized protein n=1 Tax=Uruburuella testudinis TaxID=1282863 RepID=A0ABY4DSN5_9NEIS|nr:hypothetical protein [Uruburuella testudinis]UOO81881.1 hypothetical protein LVJ83_13435 [Uruburuella testudinis]